MKLSNNELLSCVQKLEVVSQIQLPIKVSYAITKNLSKIESELKTYEKERQKLIEKYATKDAEGKVVADEKGSINIEKDSISDWNADLGVLLSIESDLDIHQFGIDELNGLNMSIAQLKAIDYMIKEQE